MKNSFKLIFLFTMILCFSPNSYAFVVDVKPTVEKTTVETFSKKELRKVKRFAKFQKKWEVRNAKRKLKKEKKRRRFFGGATDDTRFKIGLILFAASLLIGIFARVPLFGGLFGILAGLTGLVGLVLMFLALLEYY